MKFVSSSTSIADLDSLALVVKGLASGLSVLPLMGVMLLATFIVLIAT